MNNETPQSGDGTEPREVTVYEYLGGELFFVSLVDRFYDRVEADALLRPMYPDDLASSRAHMAGFLSQYWGGPQTYSEARGHPRLRMRHAPFVIGVAEAQAWLSHMLSAIDAMGVDDLVKPAFVEYFERAAPAMINSAT